MPSAMGGVASRAVVRSRFIDTESEHSSTLREATKATGRFHRLISERQSPYPGVPSPSLVSMAEYQMVRMQRRARIVCREIRRAQRKGLSERSFFVTRSTAQKYAPVFMPRKMSQCIKRFPALGDMPIRITALSHTSLYPSSNESVGDDDCEEEGCVRDVDGRKV